MIEPKNLHGIALAIKAAGGQSALAARLGIRQGTVSKWFYAGYVPRLHLIAVAELTGVPATDLERKTKRTRKGKSNGG